MSLDLNQTTSTCPPPFSIQPLCAVWCEFSETEVRLSDTSQAHRSAEPLVANVWNCGTEFIPTTEGGWGPVLTPGVCSRSPPPRLPRGRCPCWPTRSRWLACSLSGRRSRREERERKRWDESRVAGYCVIHAHKSASDPSETAVKHITQYIITQSYFYQHCSLVGLLRGILASDKWNLSAPPRGEIG